MLGLAALTSEISTAAPVVLLVTDHVRVPLAGTVEVASDKAKTCDGFVSQACLSAPAFDAGFWLSVSVTVFCAVTQLGPVAGLLTNSLSVTELGSRDFIEDVNIKREKFGLSGYERCL